MTRSLYWITLIAIVGLAIYALKPVLFPFLVAFTLAYLLSPLVERLSGSSNCGWRRLGVVCSVFIVVLLLFIATLLILLPLAAKQVLAFVQFSPAIIDWFDKVVVPWLSHHIAFDPTWIDTTTIKNTLVENWQEAGNLFAQFLKTLSASTMHTLGFFSNILIMLVVTFYLLRDWEGIMEKAKSLLPTEVAPQLLSLIKECNEVLSAFLRGQLMVMLALGVIYAMGLFWVGLPMALLIGMAAGLLSIVPYLGFIIGLVVSLIVALLSFGDWQHILAVLTVFGVGQILESAVLTPYCVGNKIGLHPVAVIFAILAGGQLFGFVGVLLALPIAAVLKVIAHAGFKRWAL